MNMPITRDKSADAGSGNGQRPLIYWTQSPSVMLRKELARRDWKVSIVAQASELRDTSGEITCGILDLSGGHADAIGSIASTCASMRDVVWVALVDVGQTASPNVRALLRDYCFDYVTLPASHQRIADTVGHAYGMECLFARDRERLESEEKGIVGTCSAMLRLFDTVRRFARTDAPVFVFGETGTGKELTAVAIHRHSERRNGPFVAVNCGAIPRICCNPNCSVMSAAHLPVRMRARSATSKRRTAARCCSTRSATCRTRARRACCVFCRNAQFIAWAAAIRCRSMSGSCRRRTSTCATRWKRALPA